MVFQEAMKQGCDQVLWLHGRNHQISEVKIIGLHSCTDSDFPGGFDEHLHGDAK